MKTQTTVDIVVLIIVIVVVVVVVVVAAAVNVVGLFRMSISELQAS